MARGSGGAPRMRTARPVVIAMMLVVSSFAASLAYSQFRLRPVNQEALDVINDAMPSIERLSTARTDLTRMGMSVAEYVVRVGPRGTVTREDVLAARRDLEAALEGYRVLRSFPGEADLLAEIEGDLSLLDKAATKVLDEADAGSLEKSRLTLRDSFHPLLLRTDEAFQRIKALNASHARANAEAILSASRAATRFAALLGIVSVVVALIASALVLRVLRSRARLIDEHVHLMADRATELESFTGRVAHDLKNPLGAMALRLVSTTRGHDLDPRLRDNLDKLTRQVQRMDRLIDGLLEFASAGAIPAPGAHADLQEIVNEVVSEISPAADAVNAALLVELFPPTRVACTPSALTSVLANLLSNAVKYIVEGEHVPRRIAVRVREHDDFARVEVEDNGPGLPPGSEQRAFEPFRRLGDSKLPGFGLGLATVKKIVDVYKGRVGVDSKLHEGSTFWFEFPKAPPA